MVAKRAPVPKVHSPVWESPRGEEGVLMQQQLRQPLHLQRAEGCAVVGHTSSQTTASSSCTCAGCSALPAMPVHVAGDGGSSETVAEYEMVI
jgi:hypothetical protein